MTVAGAGSLNVSQRRLGEIAERGRDHAICRHNGTVIADTYFSTNIISLQGLKRGCSMLVLSRKKLESILIGQDIEVIVLEVAKNRVRLGFRCPGHISIRREELQHIHEIVLEESEEAPLEQRELACV